MTLPFANLFAAYDANPRALDALARDLTESGEFSEVLHPVPGWILALAPLPDSEPDGPALRAQGLAFAEGRDALLKTSSHGEDAGARLSDSLEALPNTLAELPGDFGCVRLAANGEASIVRSCAGVVPFYFRAGRARAAIATRLGDFVRFLPDAPRLDPLVNACWAAGELVFPYDRTFLAEVSIVPPGSIARIRAGRATVSRYWDPRPDALGEPRPAEHAERLRSILLDQLGSGLDARGGNLLLLSGGVDSSALAALGRRSLGLPLMTLSFVPEENHPARTRELEFLDMLEQELGFTKTFRVPFSRSRYLGLIARAPRVVFYVLHPALGVVQDLLQETKIRCVTGGEFADEVCGSALVMADWAYHTTWRELLGSIGSWPTGPRDLGRFVKHRALLRARRPRWPPRHELPEACAPAVREEYRDWAASERNRALHDRRPHPTLAAYLSISGWNVMNWEALSPLGVRRVFPFFNREVLELAFQCHPSEQFGPGRKTLLRRAVSDLVPLPNLFRMDKGQWGHRKIEWVDAPKLEAGSVIAPILRDDWTWKAPSRIEWNDFKLIENLVLFSNKLAERRAARAVLGSGPLDAPIEMRW